MNLTKQNIRRVKAEEQTAAYAEIYAQEIQNSIDGTVIYRNNSAFREIIEPLKNAEKTPVHQKVLIGDTLFAAKKAADENKKIAILDFAEYKNPSRAFIEGRESQEAYLCHHSVLYNILSAFKKDYYQINQRKLNKSLYTDAALYIPNVKFIRKDNDLPPLNIIACSAPNRREFLKNWEKFCSLNHSTSTDKAYKNRVTFIKNICELNDIKILIAGAWGSGADGYYADNIAHPWTRTFIESSTVETIIYAIPPTKHNSYCYKHRSFEREAEFVNASTRKLIKLGEKAEGE